MSDKENIKDAENYLKGFNANEEKENKVDPWNINFTGINMSIAPNPEFAEVEDNVNHPPHYTNSKAICSGCEKSIECIDITRHMSFNIGNAVKYLWRYRLKNGKEDLRKAIWYINDEINKG